MFSRIVLRLSCLACLLAGVGLAGEGGSRPLMRNFVGLNGHTVQFRPELYRPTCGLVRDYHPVAWDLGGNSGELPVFPMAKNGVDWRRVYGSWREQGWNIDACLMVESVPWAEWKNVEADARAYGRGFAEAFGPSGAGKLVESVEIGNEPGKWSDADYARIFRAMAAGVREGDPKLKIGTCNLTTGRSGEYEKSVECVADSLELVDVLTVHTYAQMEGWPTWRRSFPEDPKLPRYLQDVDALCRWRDAHAPGKPVWITEFGYDATTKPQERSGTFARWVGVTDRQQAQWLVRSLLVFSTMPVERAYVYFFNDGDKASLHASAGLTRNFAPKPSFHALAHFQRVLGHHRFQRVVVNEPGRLRVQEYGNGTKQVVWVVWSPTGEERAGFVTLEKAPGKLVDVQAMAVGPEPEKKPKVSVEENGNLAFSVTESPVYLIFESP